MIQQTWRLDTFMSGLVVSVVLIAAIVGALIAGQICDRLGRREIIVATSATFALGAFGSGLAPSVEWLIVSRAVVGVAVGAVSVSVPLYIAEMAPARSRGALVSCNQLAITCGILLSYIAAALLGGLQDGWRHMFMTGSLLAVLLGIASVVLVELPRWLVWQDDEDDARRVMQELGAKPAEVDREINLIRRALVTEPKGSFVASLSDFVGPQMITGVGLFLFQQFVGINAVIYFAPTILTNTGFDTGSAALVATVVIGALNVVMTILSIRLLDQLGRKPLLSIGFAGMAVSLLAVSFIFLVTGHGTTQRWLVLLVLMSFIAFFAVSSGPIAWLMISEIYPTTLRGRAMSIPSSAHWLFNMVVSFVFLPLVEHLGDAPTYGLFALFAMAGWLFCRYLVPETKGRSLEEIQEQYATRYRRTTHD